MKQITAVFEDAESAAEAARRAEQAYGAVHLKIHSRSAPGKAYRPAKPFSDFFVPTPPYGAGTDTSYQQTYNFAAERLQEQRRDAAVKSARSLLSMEVNEAFSGDAAAVLWNMGATDVNVDE